MQILNIEKLNLDFSHSPLFENAQLKVNKGERICLVGRNGTGKSTFLRILNSEIEADSIELSIADGTVIAKLNQELPSKVDETAYDFVARGLSDIGDVLIQYHHHINATNQDDEWLSKLESIQKSIDSKNAWELDNRVETILSTLGIDKNINMNSLSGGWRRRLELAQVLVQNPDVLLLDEPTNHLDLKSILELEKLILSFNGTIICISHDRALIDNIATRIVELDRGNFYSYPGNFTNFLKEKEKRLEVESKQNAEFDKKLAQEEVWIRQGIKARRTRNEGRVRDLIKLREERSKRRELVNKPNFEASQAGLSGKLVVKMEKVSFNYPDKDEKTITNLTSNIIRGDKVGIVGPNGCGKSTLIKLMLGKLEPTSGNVSIGSNLKISYFDQLRDSIDLDATLIDNVGGGRTEIAINGRSKHIIGYLGDFLFTPEQARRTARKLSGGESNRLLLAKLFSLESNILVLDEPTNDLDIESLELLEDILQKYNGTVIIVSHDRYFMDNVITQLYAFDESSNITEYIGSYSDWIESQEKINIPDKKEKLVKDTQPNKPTKIVKQSQQKKLEKLLREIEKKEEKLEEMNNVVGEPEFYNKPESETKPIFEKIKSINSELEVMYEEWDSLSD